MPMKAKMLKLLARGAGLATGVRRYGKRGAQALYGLARHHAGSLGSAARSKRGRMILGGALGATALGAGPFFYVRAKRSKGYRRALARDLRRGR